MSNAMGVENPFSFILKWTKPVGTIILFILYCIAARMISSTASKNKEKLQNLFFFWLSSLNICTFVISFPFDFYGFIYDWNLKNFFLWVYLWLKSQKFHLKNNLLVDFFQIRPKLIHFWFAKYMQVLTSHLWIVTLGTGNLTIQMKKIANIEFDWEKIADNPIVVITSTTCA